MDTYNEMGLELELSSLTNSDAAVFTAQKGMRREEEIVHVCQYLVVISKE